MSEWRLGKNKHKKQASSGTQKHSTWMEWWTGNQLSEVRAWRNPKYWVKKGAKRVNIGMLHRHAFTRGGGGGPLKNCGVEYERVGAWSMVHGAWKLSRRTGALKQKNTGAAARHGASSSWRQGAHPRLLQPPPPHASQASHHAAHTRAAMHPSLS